MKAIINRVAILVLFIAVVLCSCKAGNKSASTVNREMEAYHKYALQELGEKYVVEFNESGTMILCKSGFLPDPSVSHYQVKFFIYDSEKQEIIYQDVIPRGEVVWYDNQFIKVSVIPGIIIPDQELISNTYLYDPVNKKRRTMGSTEKF